MILNYKASQIAKTEREYGMNFLSTIQELGSAPSFNALSFLVKAGGGTDDQMDELMAEKGIAEVSIAIVEGLSKSGFLGNQSIDISQMRSEIQQATEISTNSGQSKNQQPTPSA